MKEDDVKTAAAAPPVFANLDEQMQAQGAQIRVIEGDGNCFFRAMSDQLTGNCDSHGIYRRDTAEYMLAHSHLFTDFIVTDDYNEYVRTLGQDAIYVDNESLLAFANLTHVIIVVHQLNQGPILITPTGHHAPDQQHVSPAAHPEVHVTYEGQHYNSVRWSSDDADTNHAAGVTQHQLRANLDRFTALDKAQRAALLLVSDTSDEEDEESSGSDKSGVSVRRAASKTQRTVKAIAESKGVRLDKAMRALEISDYDRKTAERLLDEEKQKS